MTPTSATSNNSNGSNNSNVGPFGDTTYTKVFVGGLAWETQKDTMKKYFEQFGDILEAVVISDKATGRSKGYGFVTFREPDAAMRACVDAAPVIDGRRANCNLASLGVQRSKPSTPKHGAAGGGGRNNFRVMNSFQSGFQGGVGTAFPSAAPAAAPATFPHYAIQQGLPYNVYAGYSPYSQDYAYTPSYYNVYGGASGQYPVYGHGAASSLGGMMTGGAAAAGMAFYPSYLQFGGEGSGAGAGTGYSYTSGQGYGLQYPYHAHQQHNLVQYSAINSTTGTYPHHYGPPISLAPSPALHSGVTKVLPAPIPHR